MSSQDGSTLESKADGIVDTAIFPFVAGAIGRGFISRAEVAEATPYALAAYEAFFAIRNIDSFIPLGLDTTVLKRFGLRFCQGAAGYVRAASPEKRATLVAKDFNPETDCPSEFAILGALRDKLRTARLTRVASVGSTYSAPFSSQASRDSTQETVPYDGDDTPTGVTDI